MPPRRRLNGPSPAGVISLMKSGKSGCSVKSSISSTFIESPEK